MNISLINQSESRTQPCTVRMYFQPVCEVSLTVDGVLGNYSSRCMEASDCVNHNSLTCPDGNLDCTACILPYDPCEGELT